MACNRTVLFMESLLQDFETLKTVLMESLCALMKVDS